MAHESTITGIAVVDDVRVVTGDAGGTLLLHGWDGEEWTSMELSREEPIVALASIGGRIVVARAGKLDVLSVDGGLRSELAFPATGLHAEGDHLIAAGENIAATFTLVDDALVERSLDRVSSPPRAFAVHAGRDGELIATRDGAVCAKWDRGARERMAITERGWIFVVDGRELILYDAMTLAVQRAALGAAKPIRDPVPPPIARVQLVAIARDRFGMAVALGRDGHLYEIDADIGDVRIGPRVSAEGGAIYAFDDRVVHATGDRWQAFDRITGASLWTAFFVDGPVGVIDSTIHASGRTLDTVTGAVTRNAVASTQIAGTYDGLFVTGALVDPQTGAVKSPMPVIEGTLRSSSSGRFVAGDTQVVDVAHRRIVLSLDRGTIYPLLERDRVIVVSDDGPSHVAVRTGSGKLVELVHGLARVPGTDPVAGPLAQGLVVVTEIGVRRIVIP